MQFDLSYLKVLDLSSVLAGPMAASFFSELGAHVTKIENKKIGGDPTKQWRLTEESTETRISAYYSSANYRKKVLYLDLTLSDDKAVLIDLLKVHDIVITNFQKATAEKLGIDPYELISINPSLIIAQLNAYTYDDPRPGYDLVMQAETGWISMNGTDTDHLAKVPVAIIDMFASHQLREAILLALLEKKVSNEGKIIHVSLFKSGLAALANQASNYLMTGHIAQPLGTLHPNICPYGDVFITKDNFRLMLAIGSDVQFKKLWETLGLREDNYGNFATNSQRVQGRSELHDILQHAIGNILQEKLIHKLKLLHLPYCLVNNIKEALTNVASLAMIQSEIIEGEVTQRISNIAFSVSPTNIKFKI